MKICICKAVYDIALTSCHYIFPVSTGDIIKI